MCVQDRSSAPQKCALDSLISKNGKGCSVCVWCSALCERMSAACPLEVPLLELLMYAHSPSEEVSLSEFTDSAQDRVCLLRQA